MGINVNHGQLKKIGVRAAWGAVALLAVTGVGKCARDTRAEQRAAEEKQAHYAETSGNFTNRLQLMSRIKADGQVYVLAGPHTVETNDGGIKYVMNFRTRMVAIDGPGGADRLIGFDDMKSPAIIHTARSVACQVSRADHRQYKELRYRFSNQNLNRQGEAIIANRITFQGAHCQPGQAI